MMKKIVPSKFPGEDDIVLADHHLPFNNYLQIISCGRRVNILPSILEENHLDHGSPTPLRWFRPPTADYDQNNLELDELDLTLRLFNYSDVKSINPTPDHLGWFLDGGEDDDDVDTALSLRCPGTTHDHSEKSRIQTKGKRRASAAADDAQKKKTSKKRRNNREDDDDSRPLLPIERIPTLMKAIQSRNGTRPVFLYGKMLEKSDVGRGQNRLVVTRSMRMMDYLGEEEAAAVGDGGSRGLKIVGVDGGGNVYDNLGVTRWASMNMTVVNSDWWRVVAANGAEKGDVVEIWGFRADEKPCLAFNFRKQSFAAGSSGTSGIDDGTS